VDGATSAGGGAKTVKIIKVKVEKGTDLQELAKQLTRKIKDERDRQALTRQQQTLQSSTGASGASNSLQVALLLDRYSIQYIVSPASSLNLWGFSSLKISAYDIGVFPSCMKVDCYQHFFCGSTFDFQIRICFVYI
jgi:hypothetical protein